MSKKIVVFVIMLLFTTNIVLSSGNENLEGNKTKNISLTTDTFEFDAFCGGLSPWTPLYRLQIDESGHAIYSILPPEKRGTGGFNILDEFDLQEDDLDRIWETIIENDFFNLDPTYNSIAGDGTFANITITNGSIKYSVETKNIAILEFDTIIRFINSLTPGDQDLLYNAIINVAPNKPTQPSGPSSGKINKIYTYTASSVDENLDPLYYRFEWGDGTDSGWVGPFNSGETASASHKWTSEGEYNVSVQAKDDPDGNGDLSDGSESFWSDTLPISMPKSKSTILITFLKRFTNLLPGLSNILEKIDDTNSWIVTHILPESSGTRVTINECKIKVDIYIQIYGPGATVALTQTIETDIEDMWNTDKDGKTWMIQCKADCDPRDPGCSVEFDAHVVRMDEMHRLPGFHTWYVGTDPTGTNHGAVVTMWDYDGDGVGDGPTGNDQTIPTTTGRVDNNEPDNTYAHEAGHLMGLQDKYHELPAQDRDGDGDIDADDRRTEPNAGHGEDIMATLNGKPLQSAIDEIVSDAGIECPCECCPEEEDNDPPENNIMTPHDGDHVTPPVNVTGYADDNDGSGIVLLHYDLIWAGGSYNGSSYEVDPPKQHLTYELNSLELDPFIEPGDWITITIHATDAAGNTGSDSVTIFWQEEQDDTTPPVTEKQIGQPNEDGGYVIWPFTPITLTATDDMSGVNYIHYEVWWDTNEDGIVDDMMMSENVHSEIVMFSMDMFGILYGIIELRYLAVDNAGNDESIHKQQHFVTP